MRTIAFFSAIEGAAKANLVYHLAWMFQELGVGVVVMDLDPQARLTAAFLDEGQREQLWPEGSHPRTISGMVEPLRLRLGDVGEPHLEPVGPKLHLIPGDLELLRFEERLASAWSMSLTHDEDAFRVLSAFYRLAEKAARARKADVVLLDVGVGLDALSRAALVASDWVVLPLAAELISLRSLRILGPTIEHWRRSWESRGEADQGPFLASPKRSMQPAGYVLVPSSMPHARPRGVKERAASRIADAFRRYCLSAGSEVDDPARADHLLADIPSYQSLVQLARDTRKPMFFLKPADGALGSMAQAVASCYLDFKALADRLLEICQIQSGK